MPEVTDTLATLAWETRECPTCVLIYDKEGWGRACPDCRGDGMVLRWPGLTETCRPCCGQGTLPIFLASGERDTLGCPFCSGTGRVLKQGAKLLVAVEEALGPHTHQKHREDGLHYYWTPMQPAFKNSDRLAAAVSALAALAQRGKDA